MATAERVLFPSASLGYRAWRVKGGVLYPAHKSTGEQWAPGITVAECAARTAGDPKHKAPDKSCKCGLHAYHEPEQLRGAMMLQRVMEKDGARSFCEVIGAVAGGGDLEIHHHGWRAEQAQILGLLVVDPGHAPQWRLEATFRAGEIYRVPVFASMNDLVSHAEKFVTAVPSKHRPPAPPELSPEERAQRILEIRCRVAKQRARNSETIERAELFLKDPGMQVDARAA